MLNSIWMILKRHKCQLNVHTIESMRIKCRAAIPKVAFEYLESGRGKEVLLESNHTQYDSIHFVPKFCLGSKKTELNTTFLGQDYSSPIGLAPMGLTGLIWPNTEKSLFKISDTNEIPLGLSTGATCSQEDIDSIQIWSSSPY